MEEIGKALKVIFDKVSDFFDIFDLSFFVSGFFSTSIILMWAKFKNLPLPASVEETNSIVAIILFCYINGLLSFALGRWIRMGILPYIFNLIRNKAKNSREFDKTFYNILKAHGLEQDPIVIAYLNRVNHRGIWRLYVKYWAELRSDENHTKSLAFLKRYWVMAATYDGLSISILVAILLLAEIRIGAISQNITIDLYTYIGMTLFLIVLFFACIREANRFVEYQIEEVVASIVAKQKQ